MHKQLHPASWKKAIGYANGIEATGRQVFVGGQIGWNGDQVFETQDFAEQVEQTLQNIIDVLKEAEAGPEHITRLTWYITDKKEYLTRLKDVGAAYRKTIGRNFPAMAMVQVVALMEDDAKVEIEATAVIPE